MAPHKARVAPEDAKIEVQSAKERYPSTNSSMPTIKGRKHGYSIGGSNFKDVTATTPGIGSQSISPDTLSGIDWSTVDITLLHAYRHTHQLQMPSGFSSTYNMLVLSNPGVGRSSPTMARHKGRRRVSKDNLGLAVRKDFNAAMVNEPEVLTSFLYATYNQGLSLRCATRHTELMPDIRFHVQAKIRAQVDVLRGCDMDGTLALGGLLRGRYAFGT